MAIKINLLKNTSKIAIAILLFAHSAYSQPEVLTDPKNVGIIVSDHYTRQNRIVETTELLQSGGISQSDITIGNNLKLSRNGYLYKSQGFQLSYHAKTYINVSNLLFAKDKNIFSTFLKNTENNLGINANWLIRTKFKLFTTTNLYYPNDLGYFNFIQGLDSFKYKKNLTTDNINATRILWLNASASYAFWQYYYTENNTLHHSRRSSPQLAVSINWYWALSKKSFAREKYRLSHKSIKLISQVAFAFKLGVGYKHYEDPYKILLQENYISMQTHMGNSVSKLDQIVSARVAPSPLAQNFLYFPLSTMILLHGKKNVFGVGTLNQFYSLNKHFNSDIGGQLIVGMRSKKRLNILRIALTWFDRNHQFFKDRSLIQKQIFCFGLSVYGKN